MRRLPPGAVLFRRSLRVWRAHPGWGFGVEHPLPSAATLVGCRPPIVEREGRICGRGAVTWLSGGAPTRLPVLDRDPDAGDAPEVAVRGTVIRVGGRPFAQGLDREDAARLALWLRGLASPGSDLRGEVGRELAASLRWERLREQLEGVALETRWLRAASDAYAAALFALAPLLVAWLGPEAGLLRALPLLGALHLATLVAFVRSSRRLHPDRGGDLAESSIAMGLYPPLLLRAHQQLVSSGLDRYHPAAVAAVVLEGAPLRDFLRAELVRADAAAARGGKTGLDALEAAALEALIASLGQSREDLLAPPAREPGVEGYCPACHECYRRSAGECTDCGIALVAFA